MNWEQEQLEAEERGKKKGLEQGIIQSRLETAHKMKAKGMSIEDIMDITGLTLKQIAEI